MGREETEESRDLSSGGEPGMEEPENNKWKMKKREGKKLKSE